MTGIISQLGDVIIINVANFVCVLSVVAMYVIEQMYNEIILVISITMSIEMINKRLLWCNACYFQ